jgi:hypothetical protein
VTGTRRSSVKGRRMKFMPWLKNQSSESLFGKTKSLLRVPGHLPSPNSAPEEETPVYLKGVRSPSQERPGGPEPVGVEPGDVEVAEPYRQMSSRPVLR